MNRQLFITEDGSHSICVPDLNVSYHSKHGALQESQHIYIGAGLMYLAGIKRNISVLEVGFGTGLKFLQIYAIHSHASTKTRGLAAAPREGANN